MRAPVAALLSIAASLFAGACDPRQDRAGEYYAGPVDPSAFPAAYRARDAATGAFPVAAAHAHDVAVAYAAFPFVASARASASDPLALAAPPAAYLFDGRCTAPAGYAYDARRDAYRLDAQGAVFTALPSAATYAPIVSAVPVGSNGEACQSIKSLATLAARDGGDVIVAPPDGRVLALAIVDPDADAPVALGWIDHQLVTYLDGGELPVASLGGGDLDAIAQNLYYPSTAGAVGAGFDLVDAARGEAGYSPLCHVFSYAPVDPQHLPTSAAALEAAQLHDTGGYVWCLQVVAP